MRKILFSLVLLAGGFVLLCGYDVVVVSDTHYDAPDLRPDVSHLAKNQVRIIQERNWKTWQNNMPEYLKQYRAKAAKADFVIHCGDITHGKFSEDKYQIEAVKRGMAVFSEGIPCKFYCLKGNHESYCKQPVATSWKTLADYLGTVGISTAPDQLNYAFTHLNDLYIAIDYTRPDVNFVRKTLAAHPKCRHVFLLTHFPLLPCSFGNNCWIVLYQPKQQKALKKLIAMLAERNAVIICGDIHRNTLIRADFPEGTLTQISVFSLPESSGKAQVKKMDADTYLNHVKPNGKPFLAPHLHEVFSGHYREFLHYTPDSGLFVLQVNDDGSIVMQKHDIKGKFMQNIIIKESNKR